MGRVVPYIELIYCLNSARDKEIWMAISGLAARLEYLAPVVLWVDAGRPGAFGDFEERLTLLQARARLEAKHLLDPKTLSDLRLIGQLRNRLSHRTATEGVTMPTTLSGGELGIYKGRHVFSDHRGFTQLIDDYDAATTAMVRWLRDHDLTGDGNLDPPTSNQPS